MKPKLPKVPRPSRLRSRVGQVFRLPPLLILVLTLSAAGALWYHHLRNPAGQPPAATPAAPPSARASLVSPEAPPSARIIPASSTTPDPVLSLPASIQPIYGLRGESFDTRLRAIHSLRPDLTTSEISALCDFLRAKSQTVTNLDAERVLKNDTLNALQRQNPPARELGRLLIDVYRDKEQDVVLRDYAVQHLFTWYEQVAAQEFTPPLIDAAQIQQILTKALDETSSSIAGTALLAFDRLAQSHPEFDRERVGAAALNLLRNPASSELAQISAIQVCAELKLKEAVPAAMELAQTAASIPLRISAIGAIGNAGENQQLDLLAKLAASDNAAVKLAANSALNQLQARLRGQPSLISQ